MNKSVTEGIAPQRTADQTAPEDHLNRRPVKRKPGRFRRWALLAVLAAAIAAVLWWALNRGTAPITVETVEVTRGDLGTSLDLTGVVINDYTVTITALLNGEITAIKAREGDVVEADAVLATLDPRKPEAGVQKARAELDYQRQNVTLAERRHERTRSVSRQGNESRQALDDSLLNLQSARSAVRVAEANLEIAELEQQNSTVRAPFAGTVVRQVAEKGQWVEAGTELFTLVATAGRVIEVQVDASDAARVTLGQRARLDANVASAINTEESSWSSEVTWRSGSVTRNDESKANTFAVRLALEDNAPELLLGQQVDVQLMTESRDDVVLVPLQAVTEIDADNVVVYLLDGDVAREHTIRLGLSSIDQGEVLSGLTAGDTIVLPPRGEALTDGVQVTVAP